MAKRYRIAVLPGDGIGPEVTREAIETIRLAADVRGFALDLTQYPFGADHYMKSKEMFPASALEEMRGHDAILLGAIGDPRLPVGLLERAVISGIRFGLDLYVNLHPVKLYAEHLCPLKGKRPEDVDMVVVRENTEDVYAGIGGFLKKGTPDEVAMQEMIFTRKGTERVIRYAFDLCRRRAKTSGCSRKNMRSRSGSTASTASSGSRLTILLRPRSSGKSELRNGGESGRSI